jgi:hypothetical protein
MKVLADGRGRAKVSKTTVAIVNGDLDISVWSDEELLRGQRKNKNGKWTGRAPVLLPAHLVHELTKRRFQRAHVLLADSLVDCVQMLRAVVNDRRASKSDRIKAAELIMDRVLGKPKESVELDINPGWQSIVAQAIVPVAEEAIEGELVDDEDEPDSTGKQMRKEARLGR